MNTRLYHLDRYFYTPRLFGNVGLIQIGRLLCARDTAIPEHVHLNWYELTVIKSGAGILGTNGVELPVGQGDIFLSFPADIHSILPDRDNPLGFDFLSLYPQDAPTLAAFEKIQSAFRAPQSRLFSDERIAALVNDAISEFDRGATPRSDELVEHLLRLILLYLERDFTEKAPPPVKPNQAELFCYALMNYIDTHIFTMKSLSELSDVFNYDYAYISRLFKYHTGHTLWSYYQNSRLKRARLLLAEKSRKVSEIAEMLNYSSVYAFSKAYKHRFGFSPTRS